MHMTTDYDRNCTERDAPRDFEGHACAWCGVQRWPDEMAQADDGTWCCTDPCVTLYDTERRRADAVREADRHPARRVPLYAYWEHACADPQLDGITVVLLVGLTCPHCGRAEAA